MRLSIFAGDDRHEAATVVGGPALLAASTTAVARAVLLIGVVLSQVIGPSPLTTQAADALTTATGPPTYVYDSPSASTTHTSNARIDPARERGATAGHMWSSTFLISRGHATKAGQRTIDDLDLDALSRSGRDRVASKLEQHQGGKFPEVTGGPKAKQALGQDQLDDILTAPGSHVEEVTSGNFDGGFRVIARDGRGATFDSAHKFQYFGEY